MSPEEALNLTYYREVDEVLERTKRSIENRGS